MKLVAGVFDVAKPYFNNDERNVFAVLGDVRHRGAEFSLAGNPTERLSLVAGPRPPPHLPKPAFPSSHRAMRDRGCVGGNRLPLAASDVFLISAAPPIPISGSVGYRSPALPFRDPVRGGKCRPERTPVPTCRAFSFRCGAKCPVRDRISKRRKSGEHVMTLAQLRYLVAIIDAQLNMTDAAAAVHATQSGLSQQIRQLEDELGFQIFVRGGRRLDRVSEAGMAVVESARLILAEASNIDAMAANERGATEGELRIVTTQAQAQYVLPAPLSAMRARFPRVRVQLDLGCEHGPRDLAGATYDIAVISAQAGSVAHGAAIPLYHWTWRLLVPPDHPFAACRTPVPLEEIARHPLIGFESISRRDGAIVRCFDRAGVTFQMACSAPDSEVVKAYVRAGLGVGLVPEMAVDDAAEDLAAVRVDPRLPTSTAWAVLPPDRVARDYVIDLVMRLAPRFSRLDIRRAIAAGGAATGDAVPHWRPSPSVRSLRLAS